jgi:lysophospholipase L1-like esterase
MNNTPNFRFACRAVLAATGFLATSGAMAADVRDPWIGTWSVAPQPYPSNDSTGKTLRQVVHASVSGTSVRIHLSNAFGTQPLGITDVHVGLWDGGATVLAGSDRAVTFNALPAVTVSPGRDVVSDGVDLPVPASGDVLVSFYVTTNPGKVTGHSYSNQDGYVAEGDVAGQATLSATTQGDYRFLTGVDVQSSGARGGVVLFGASLTDGFNSTYNANRRWSNDLALRINAAGLGVGVMNKGISGNNLLQDGGDQLSGQHRFDQDVLAQPGVRWVVLSDDPLNDLGSGNPAATSANLIAALQGLMAKAHARGIGFICSTLTPWQGSPSWTVAREASRADVNAFVRSAGNGCDGVIDQDTATHDPARPAALLPAFDSGDHIHPNDAGYQAIANAVPLSLYTPVTLPPVGAPTGCGTLDEGEGLQAGQTVVSCGGLYTLNMQLDGNLVLYKAGGTPLWATGTAGEDSDRMVLSADGNLTVFGALGEVLWSSGSGGQGAARLFVQDDGNIVIYNNDGVVWNSQTAGR